MLKIGICQKVQCGPEKFDKSLSGGENLNYQPITVNNLLFKFSTHDSDLAHFFEPHVSL